MWRVNRMTPCLWLLAKHRYYTLRPLLCRWPPNYGPEKVVDALAAILNQITGRHFGFIYNGATDAERTKTVRAWRDFLRKTPKAKLCEAG